MSLLSRAARIPSALVILFALIGGVLLGIALEARAPGAIEAGDVIGTIWLNALRMTVIPLVIALLVTGIVQTARMARAGRLTGIAVATMIAILWLSSTIAALLTPALLTWFPIPAEAAAAMTEALGVQPPPEAVPPFSEFIKALVPTNPISAAANDAVLPLIIFTLTFAFALTRLPPVQRDGLGGVFEALAAAMLKIISWVLSLAPIGVFGLAMVVGARAGAAAFGMLAHYVLVVSSVGAVVWLLAYPLAIIGGRRRFTHFLRASISAQAVALSTQSSLASLPAMVQGTRALEVDQRKAEVILPIAVALFRATGPAMNFAVAIYVAYWVGIELTPLVLLTGLAVGAITTMGAVSLPGSISFISSIAPINLAMGVPVAPLGLLVPIEPFPDLMRTVGNVTMDIAVATTVAERTAPLDALEAELQAEAAADI